jgi:hypothetical protein
MEPRFSEGGMARDRILQIVAGIVEYISKYLEKRGYAGQRPSPTVVLAYRGGTEVRSGAAASSMQGDGPGAASRSVFLVEHRQHVPSFVRDGALLSYRADLAFIASSLEIAIEWCRNNINYAPHSYDKSWDFAIRKRDLDAELIGGGLVMVMDWNGEVTGWTV